MNDEPKKISTLRKQLQDSITKIESVAEEARQELQKIEVLEARAREHQYPIPVEFEREPQSMAEAMGRIHRLESAIMQCWLEQHNPTECNIFQEEEENGIFGALAIQHLIEVLPVVKRQTIENFCRHGQHQSTCRTCAAETRAHRSQLQLTDLQRGFTQLENSATAAFNALKKAERTDEVREAKRLLSESLEALRVTRKDGHLSPVNPDVLVDELVDNITALLVQLEERGGVLATAAANVIVQQSSKWDGLFEQLWSFATKGQPADLSLTAADGYQRAQQRVLQLLRGPEEENG